MDSYAWAGKVLHQSEKNIKHDIKMLIISGF